MDKLTSEQKRLMEEEEKKHKAIPIKRERFEQILIKIGRKAKNV